MRTQLDTYDPSSMGRLNRVSDKLSSLYASKNTSDGLRSTKDIMTNEFFRMRQKELREEELNATLSQFKTIEECTKHHESELGDVISDFMVEYINHGGNIRDERIRLGEDLYNAVMQVNPDNAQPKQLPETVRSLTKIQNAGSLETARDVYDQFCVQCETIEQDFKSEMRALEGKGNYNVTTLNDELRS
ncbi:MAG: hypothetical protein ACRBB3_02690 [Alphaproteobacteria bacterium]